MGGGEGAVRHITPPPPQTWRSASLQPFLGTQISTTCTRVCSRLCCCGQDLYLTRYSDTLRAVQELLEAMQQWKAYMQAKLAEELLELDEQVQAQPWPAGHGASCPIAPAGASAISLWRGGALPPQKSH